MHRYLAGGAHGFMRTWLVVVVLCMLCAVWMLWPATTSAPASTQPVGLMQRAYSDTSRPSWGSAEPRPLATLVWYPAIAGALEKEWSVAIFQAGHNARGAAMAASPAKLPLVVMSHGTGGSAAGLSWLAESLARRGFIVAALNHHGNTAAESNPRLEGTLVWWDRAQDLRLLIDRLLADPQLGPRIDSQRIGVAGFSIGGYTALATVGARLSRAQFDAFCATESNCPLPPEMSDTYTTADALRLMRSDARLQQALAHMEDDYTDPRIRAAFVMAPVVGFAMTEQSLAAIRVPVHMVVGKDDDQAVPALDAEPIAAHIPGATLEVLSRGSHYAFLPPCNARGKLFAKEICVDAPGIDRMAIHAKVSADAVAFFQQMGLPR